MTASFALTGGCHCGAVRYRVTAPARELCHCHCSICRRIHGAVFASFAIVERTRFRIEHGADVLTRYDSSAGAQRYFCSRCGGQIYSDVDSLPEIRFYAVGTLDNGPSPRDRASHLRNLEDSVVADHGCLAAVSRYLSRDS